MQNDLNEIFLIMRDLGYSKEEMVVIINNGTDWKLENGKVTFKLRNIKQANKYYWKGQI